MYRIAFGYMLPWHNAALLLMAAFVVVSQLKINVMNAYAGLARLVELLLAADAQPSRPRHLAGLQRRHRAAPDGTRHLPAAGGDARHLLHHRASRGSAPISADLFINKPLGLAPPGIEFKRAHLYDINPVGVGAMALVGDDGADRAFRRLRHAPPPRLRPSSRSVVAFVASPAIAWATGGKYYLARKPRRGLEEPAADDHLLDLRASRSSRRTWPGARPMPRRSARSAARSMRAATTCASRTPRLQRPDRQRSPRDDPAANA